jgi:hypothetical protein
MEDKTNELEKIMDSMVKNGATVMVANTKTIQQMQEQGVPIQKRFIPYEQYLEDLINKKRPDAIALLRQLPVLDESIADGVVSEIYEEIRSSYGLGFFTSTIVNSIFLLEYAMRAALYAERLKTDPNTPWSALENDQMNRLIGKLRRANLIDEAEKDLLTEFSENMRNPYLHINIQKMSEGIFIEKLPGVNIHTQETIELTDVKVSEHQFLWFTAKRFFDKHHVQPTIDFCVGWTNKLLTDKSSKV